MARSLFARLARRFGHTMDGPTRRQFLNATLAASAGLLLSGPGNVLAESAPGGRGKPKGKRIVIIGAGFSGLACAHELRAVGYDVTIIEARNRVGGRVLSFGDFVEGKVVEGGGELIGSNHPTWVNYAKKFNFEFSDLVDQPEDFSFPVVLDGNRLSNDEASALWEQMDAAVKTMNDDARAIDADQPWLSPNAQALDQRTTQDWIDKLDVPDLCKRGLSALLTADNGVTPAKQSYLGNLTQVKGGGVETYWVESEVYRCLGGNQQLAHKLAEGVGANHIVLNLAVTSIETRNNLVTVTCRDGRTLECDDVVLAVPPSVWKKIDFKPPLPPSLKPQMGVNIKHLTAVSGPFWRNTKTAPEVLTDGDISMSWESINVEGLEDDTCLVAFSGGDAAERVRAKTPAERNDLYNTQLEALLPGYKDAVLKTPRFMDWPGDPWTLAGYSFPAPGQITTMGPLLRKGLGRIHFAGEHTSYAFVGYMEGALNSGVSLAKRLAQRDGVIDVEEVKVES